MLLKWSNSCINDDLILVILMMNIFSDSLGGTMEINNRHPPSLSQKGRKNSYNLSAVNFDNLETSQSESAMILAGKY